VSYLLQNHNPDPYSYITAPRSIYNPVILQKGVTIRSAASSTVFSLNGSLHALFCTKNVILSNIMIKSIQEDV